MERNPLTITGVTGLPMDSARIKTKMYLHIQGRNPMQIEVYGLKQIGITTPISTSHKIHHIRELSLADPEFDKPAKVDLILGADIYNQLLKPGFQRRGSLLAQNTVFGWIITGPTTGKRSQPEANAAITTSTNEEGSWHEKLVSLLQRFWSLEEIPRKTRISAEDSICENLYATQHSRDNSGRYIVPLPLKALSEDLGDNLTAARIALRAQQRRMQRDKQLKEEYIRFMKEYLELGHMRQLTEQEVSDHTHQINYIPHHGIWQRGDNVKKFRVVFDASRKTESGRSLNDTLYSGPKLQSNLVSVVSRWRKNKIAYCADIKMMFRQILIKQSDTHLQRIIWSPEPDQPEKHFALLTVTYGETCSPYLALRTLQQLCADEGSSFPEAVRSIKQELYVDDFLSGGDNVTEARKCRNELIKLLRKGGFELKKWVSNRPELINDIPICDRLRPTWRHFEMGGLVNELGLAWDPVEDEFRFSPPSLGSNGDLTKRKALAELARLFDPIGWLAPLIVVGKMHIQDLWRGKLSWDEKLPASMTSRWMKFRESIEKISSLSLPRWINYNSNQLLQLHVFTDASRRVMAATVYSRTSGSVESAPTQLLSAKTKLSPIKSLLPASPPAARMTIPRLELRAALLGAKLIRVQAEALSVDLKNCFAWSDSQVVIRWLSSSDPVGNDLVDNYISNIQELLPGINWFYVPTNDNPADLATRGTNAVDLASNKLWWNGPPWLSQANHLWPEQQPPPSQNDPCNPRNPAALQCCTAQTTTTIIDRFSSLMRLLRALVRCRRLINSCKESQTPPLNPITTQELEQEFLTCVKISQQQDFAAEIRDLEQRSGSVRSSSSIARLKPYTDERQILRVGGRLENSSLCNEEKHPPILDGRSHLARLIIDWAHQRALHAGPTVTYGYVLKRAWIIGGRSKTNCFVRQCVVCTKTTRRTSTQLMADLPASRVNPARAFSKTGVDYAGPFQVLRSKGRGISSTKAYVSVFVCLTTKAIHLELVGDLTTDSFLGALTRFSGRRGQPLELWSDNATNFRGADAELRKMFQDANLDWSRVESDLAQKKTKWNFIPPSAPHFGGLWEAGVKSMKKHLRRVVDSRKLTYEEFTTLLVEIEMVLNSRPMVPLSGDLDDLDVLTPGHFLIGAALNSMPRLSSADENLQLDRLTHWQLVRGACDRFWRRWSSDYLNTLQQRAKWTIPKPNLKVGDLVVVIDPSLLGPNGRWPIGRITQTHSGADQLVRIATLKTHRGIYTRPVTKLVQLPITIRPSTPSNGHQTAGGTE